MSSIGTVKDVVCYLAFYPDPKHVAQALRIGVEEVSAAQQYYSEHKAEIDQIILDEDIAQKAESIGNLRGYIVVKTRVMSIGDGHATAALVLRRGKQTVCMHVTYALEHLHLSTPVDPPEMWLKDW